MKKEIIICLIVIVSIVTLNILAETHTDLTMDRIEENLNELRVELLSENTERINNINEKTITTFDTWKDEKDLLAIYIEHNELEKIEMYLWEIKSNVETKEFNIAVQSLDTCNFIMEHIKEKYKFNIKNIF